MTEVIAVRTDLFTALAFEFSELDECETVARELLRLAAQWREQAEREALKVSKRKTRLPGLPVTYDKALEAEILDAMRDWPSKMEARLKALDLENFAKGGDLLWQAKFEFELMQPDRDPDTLSAIVWLAEAGHLAAREALRRYMNVLLEDGKADLPTSVRSYLLRLINGLVPAHPEDRSEVIKNMLRDVAIWVMVDAAAARWSLPRLNSTTRRHSAASLVGEIVGLRERQVRRICQDRGELASSLARFLLGDQTI